MTAKVLLVDDEIALAELLRGYATTEGFMVDTLVDELQTLARLNAGMNDQSEEEIELTDIVQDAGLEVTAKGCSIIAEVDDYLLTPGEPRTAPSRNRDRREKCRATRVKQHKYRSHGLCCW